MKLESRVRHQVLRLGALGIVLFFGTFWARVLAFLARLSLALVASLPWPVSRGLGRLGRSARPVVRAVAGLKASGLLGGAAALVMILGVACGPSAGSSGSNSRSAAGDAAATTRPTATATPATAASERTAAAAQAANAPTAPTLAPVTTPTAAPPTVAPTPQPTPPPTAAPTVAPTAPPPLATANLVITQLNYDGVVPRTEADEYVQITSRGGAGQAMSGWRIVSVRAGQTYAFPNMTIAAGQTCRVYTNEIHPEWCSLSWGRGSAVWNNAGDRANLVDPAGHVVSTSGYGGY